jgi:hypothetical protein
MKEEMMPGVKKDEARIETDERKSERKSNAEMIIASRVNLPRPESRDKKEPLGS